MKRDRDRDIVPENAAASGVVPAAAVSDLDRGLPPETDREAEAQGIDTNWQMWRDLLRAALLAERRWRAEALASERMAFGPDDDPGTNDPSASSTNKINDKTALIHSNIEVLKPLIFSETPTPIVRRRFRGDSNADETDLMAAEAAQRIAQFLLETEPFDDAMRGARDDWLIAGRGSARVYYKATFGIREFIGPDGQIVAEDVKETESVCPRHTEWRRFTTAPGHGWEEMPWIAFEAAMTRTQIEKRFGQDVAAAMNYRDPGLIHASQAVSDMDDRREESLTADEETGARASSPFDTALVWEIWDKDSQRVIWWSNGYPQGILDKEDDPLSLEGFWPMPKPLLASTKGSEMTPRPDIRYYEQRANEIDLASKKLKSLLNVISVSALIPSEMTSEIKKILEGDNVVVPIPAWIKLMEKGGTANVVQWLPLQAIISAVQALIILREQAKQAMYEASGVSDIMRSQGDPNETATAQAIKGRYAGLRLSDRQTRMAIYARDTLRIMIELALEHFDTNYLADICGLDIPVSEDERAAMQAMQIAEQQEYEATAQAYQFMAQEVQAAGQDPVQHLGPPPEPPKHDRIPETSFELVHDRLRTDMGRKLSVQIETQSTVLADEQADKEARVEFLAAMSTFVSQIMPLLSTGQFDMKTAKELLLFGVRGFPKSRTLESMIANLPDELEGEQAPETEIQVAQIKAETDAMIEKMRLEDKEKDREHEIRLRGADMLAEAARQEDAPGRTENV